MFGKRITFKTISILSVASLFSGCSGGSGVHESSLPPVSGVQPSTKVSTASRSSITIAIPIATTATQSTSRALKYISSFTKSVSISTNGQAPVNTNVGTTLPGCQSVSSQEIACTIGFDAPLGADTLGVKLYDGSGASGNVLSSAQVAVNIDGSPQNIPITLSGAAAKIILSTPSFTISPCAPTGSVSQTQPLTVNAYDIDGNLIVGSAAYLNPITIVVNDASGNTTLSKTTVISPADIVNVTHVANFGATTPITITATGAGITTANSLPLTLKIPISISAQQTTNRTDNSSTQTYSQVVTVTPSIGYGSDIYASVWPSIPMGNLLTQYCKVSTNPGTILNIIPYVGDRPVVSTLDEFVSLSTLGSTTSWNLATTAYGPEPYLSTAVLATPVKLYSTPVVNTSWSVDFSHISPYTIPQFSAMYGQNPDPMNSLNSTGSEVASATIPSTCSLSSGVTAPYKSVTINDNFQIKHAEYELTPPYALVTPVAVIVNDSIVSYMDPFIGNFCSSEIYQYTALNSPASMSALPPGLALIDYTPSYTVSLTATLTAPPVIFYTDGTSGTYIRPAMTTGSLGLIPPTITPVQYNTVAFGD